MYLPLVNYTQTELTVACKPSLERRTFKLAVLA